MSYAFFPENYQNPVTNKHALPVAYRHFVPVAYNSYKVKKVNIPDFKILKLRQSTKKLFHDDILLVK